MGCRTNLDDSQAAKLEGVERPTVPRLRAKKFVCTLCIPACATMGGGGTAFWPKLVGKLTEDAFS